MKEGQVYKIKEGQEAVGLPAEVTISRVDGEVVFITSNGEGWESTKEIVETFYVAKEEFTAESMPKLAMEAIDEAISLLEVFVSTQNPMAGLQAKTKLVTLKDNIAKTVGLKVATPASVLGKKVL
jgi:hypothetical protein